MTAPPPPEPQLQLPVGGTSLQRRIADAAIELFSSHGATATSVREITAACGLSPGALYNHFSSKEQLLYVLIRDIHVLGDQGLEAAIAAAVPEPRAQLEAAASFLVRRAAGPRKQSRVANREYTTLPRASREEIIAIRRRMRSRFAEILLAGAQTGEFTLPGSQDATAAVLTATAIATLCSNISEWASENYPVPMSNLLNRYVEMALRLAGARPSAPPGQ
jgi:TetR/AcrR family transcriptional regulator, cholesterol catabolism regulator